MFASRDAFSDKYLTIGTVARLTGIPCATLRAWEKRYGIRPAGRNAAGRREYSRANLEQLMLLKALLDLGVKIGDVAHLDPTGLNQLFSALQAKRLQNQSQESPQLPAGPQPERLKTLIRELEQLEKSFSHAGKKPPGKDHAMPARYCSQARALLQRALQLSHEPVQALSN